MGGGRCLKPASVSAQPLRIGIPNVWAEVLPPTRGRDLGLKFTASLCGQWKSRASELAAEGVSSEASSDAVYGWNCPPWSRLGGTVFLVFSLREEKKSKSVKAAEEHSRGLSQADGNKPLHGGGRDVLTAHAVGNPAGASPKSEGLGNAVLAQRSGAPATCRNLLTANAVGNFGP